MTNSIAKRALTVAVAAATILWSVGFAALTPQTVSAASYGDLIKGTTLSTVYYYGSDGQRYSFPNEKSFFSWYNDFSGVVTLSDAELANITLAGNIVYRSGARWIKITSDEKTYAVARDGKIHWIESEEVAKGLAGDNWNQFIDDVPDVFFVDYSVGDSLTSAASAYEGALVMSGSDTYLVWDGKKMKVSAEGMTANMFKSGFVLDGTGVNLSSMTAGSDVTSKLAYLTDAAQKVETADYETAKDVSVSFAGSPSASTLIDDQGIADLLHVTLTNNGASSVNLTKLALTRTGVSSDATLDNIYLFKGYNRLTDAATVSSGVATFNDSTGIVSLAAGASETLVVRADIGDGASGGAVNGQTVGLKLAASDDLSFSSSGVASGSFPMEGALHTIASNPSSSFATMDFDDSTPTPSSAVSLDPGEDIRLWEQNLDVGVNEVDLYVARFRNIGSINAEDVTNWTLYIGGVQRGDVVASEDEDGYITFDLSGSPVELKTGAHAVKVLADVIGGSGRTITIGLRNSADFIAMDQDYDQPVLPSVGGTAGTFSAMDTAVQTVNSGSLTFTKATDSPSGDVVDTASGVTLGKWTVKAFGESMKVEKLRLAVDDSDDSAAMTLRNGAVFLNGSQIGSTAALAGISDTTLGYTEYSFGSSFIVVPGSPATLEVRSDMVDSDGTDEVTNDDTFIARIVAHSSVNNVQRVSSGSYIDAPTSATTANTLTVAAGSLTVAKNTSYANQTTVKPKTNYKVGSFSVTAGTSEAINLTDINVVFTDATTGDTTDAATDLSNLYVKYGPLANMTTSSTKGSVTEASQSWSINYALGAGETIYVDVYADLDDAITNGETVIVNMDVNGNNELSGSAANGTALNGQTITTAAGAFTTAVGDTSIAKVVSAGQTVEAAKFKFTAENDTYTIREIQVAVDGATDAVAQAASGVINTVELYDGSTLVGSGVMSSTSGSDTTSVSTVNGASLITGLDIDVAADSSKTITVKLVLNDITSGGAASQNNLAVTLDSVEYADSDGTVTTSTTNRTGNEVRAYNSVPTVSHVDLTNSTLVNGQASDIYKFTVTAGSNGSIALKQLALPISFTDADADTLVMESWKLYKNGTDVSTSSTAVVIEDEDGSDIEGTDDNLVEADTTVYVIWDTSEEVIAAGETVTYTLRATPQGFDSDGDTGDEDYFTIYLAGDTSHNSNGGTPGLTDVCLDDTGTGNIWQLGDTAAIGTDCTAADTNSSAHNFIWSDLSLSGHDGTETTAPDWANGYLIKNLDLDGETWSK